MIDTEREAKIKCVKITRDFRQILPITEARNVCHLDVGHAKQFVPVLVLELHDVKHTLHTLQDIIGNFTKE